MKHFVKLQNGLIYPRVKVQWQTGHYMITNSHSAKCVHCVRSEFVTAVLLMIQFYWDVMRCSRQDVPAFLNCCTLKIKVTCSFQMFGTTHTVTVSQPTGLQSRIKFL